MTPPARRLLAAAALLLACLLPTVRVEAKPPNVIFFIVDDQGRGEVPYTPEGRDGDAGRPGLMPALGRLAGEGVVLDRLTVPSAVCIPSRFSVLTGRYGSRARNAEMLELWDRHGYPAVGQNAHIVAGQTTTVAGRLRDAGYATGVVGKNHVVEVPDWVRLPHDADIHDPAVAAQLVENQRLVGEAFRASGFDFAERLYHDNLYPNGPGALVAHNLDWVTQGALDFIDQSVKSDKPFFLYYSSTLPHGPNDPDIAWRADRRITPVGLLDAPPGVLPSAEQIQKRLDDAGVADPQVGNAVWIDAALGKLVEKLEADGVADNTVIIYFNDHGVEAGKTTVYEGGMSTHGLAWSGDPARVAGGRRTAALVSSVDFAPTMLAWAGVDPAATAGELDGVSLAPLLAGQMAEARLSAYGEIGYSRAVRMGDFKYVALRPSPWLRDMSLDDKQAILDRWFARRDAMGVPREPNKATDPFPHIIDIPGGVDNTWGGMRKHPHYFDADQLYDLAADPDEQVNLADDPGHAAVRSALRAELARYLSTLPGQFGEFPGAGGSPHDAE